MSNTIDLGKIGITMKGAWDPSATYEYLDIVTKEGNSYIAIKGGKNNNPSILNSEYWKLLAQKGGKGIKGQDGKDGKDGINGTNGANGKDGKDGKDGIDATPEIVEQWLAENITNPTNPTIDNTLKISGAAADAFAVGNNMMMPSGALPNGQDMNELIIPGIYRKSDSKSWSNYPTELSDKAWVPIIIVLYANQKSNITSTTSAIIQILITRNRGIFLREKTPTAWSDWKCIKDTIDIDNTLSISGVPADAKIVGDIFKYGNLSQRVKINPMVIGNSFGECISTRSELEIINENGLKVTQNNTTNYNSYGIFMYLYKRGTINNGHKIYFRVSGIDISGETSFNSFRILPYKRNATGTNVQSGTSIEIPLSRIKEDGSYENIIKLDADTESIMFLLIQKELTNGTYFSIDNIQWIDLTETFGEGYEPKGVGNFIELYSDLPYNYFVSPVQIDRSAYKASSTVSIGGENSAKIKKIIQQLREEWEVLRAIDFEKEKDNIEYLPEGKYQGLPYSAMIGFGGDILYNRNLNTFFSAVKNPASIMYRPHLEWGAAQMTNYGTVCMGLTGWINSCPVYYLTSSLSRYEQVEWYEYNGPKCIKIGDCLLGPLEGGEGHIIIIYDIEVDRNTYQTKYIDTFEQTGSISRTGDPWCRTLRLTVEEFEAYLIENGGGYKLCRYKNSIIRDVEPVRYALDIIPDMGDRTYYYANDYIYLYFPVVPETLYYKKQNDSDYMSINISNLPTTEINETTVYDVTDIISDYDTYILTTNIKNLTQCKITRINTGTITINGSNVTLSGYSNNISPVWTETLYIFTEENPKSARRPICYQGYEFGYVTGSIKPIESDTFTTPLPQKKYGYQVRVYFETGYGQAFIDSDIIWQQ